VIDALIDLILGHPLAAGAAVAGLTTGAATLGIACNNAFAFALASARRCWRVLGGSCEGGFELLRELERACSSKRPMRASKRAISPW